METNKRAIAKAFCWQAVGLIVMTLIGYIFTGSASEGGALALTSAAIGLVSYFLHEKLWARVRWGRIMGA
jgi:uncharacterized membrane protein